MQDAHLGFGRLQHQERHLDLGLPGRGQMLCGDTPQLLTGLVATHSV